MSQPVPARVAALPTGHATPTHQAFLRMPILRQPVLRQNARHRLGRPEYDAATLGHRVGQEQVPACDRCQRGAGPFAACVTVQGHFDQMCTNCRYSSAFHGCSFRSVAPPAAVPFAPVVSAPAVSAPPRRRTPARGGSVARRPVRPRSLGSRRVGRASAPAQAFVPASTPASAEVEYLPASPRTLARRDGFSYPDPDHYAAGTGPYSPYWLKENGGAQNEAEEEEMEEDEEEMEENEEEGDEVQDDEEMHL